MSGERRIDSKIYSTQSFILNTLKNYFLFDII